MMEPIHRIASFFRYFFASTHHFNIHSPAVFQFCEEILYNEREFYSFKTLSTTREYLYEKKEVMVFTPSGAKHKPIKERVDKRVKRLSISDSYGRLLFKIINHYQCKSALELGTGSGLGTLYMALANAGSQMITVDGDRTMLSVAEDAFSFALAKNITCLHSDFGEAIRSFIKDGRKFDLIVIDGDHTYEKSKAIMTSLYPLLLEKSIVIIDDIHWSAEMSKFWRDTKKDPRVIISIDIYQLGILFFDHRLTPGHYTLWY